MTLSRRNLTSRFKEDFKTRVAGFLFPFLNLDTVFNISTYWGKFANSRQIERGGMIAIEFSTVQIDFLSDVFTAVAITIAEASYS